MFNRSMLLVYPFRTTVLYTVLLFHTGLPTKAANAPRNSLVGA